MTDGPEFNRWLSETAQRNGEAMEKSKVFLALVTPNYMKDSLAILQLGLAVALDKPIYLLVEQGTEIPENTRRLARGCEWYLPGDQVSLAEATTRLLKKGGMPVAHI